MKRRRPDWETEKNWGLCPEELRRFLPWAQTWVSRIEGQLASGKRFEVIAWQAYPDLASKYRDDVAILVEIVSRCWESFGSRLYTWFHGDPQKGIPAASNSIKFRSED